MLVSVIVAAAENGVVGVDNSLPWHLPEDLKYFKRVTLGKPIIMGRKTFESIGRPLPSRANIVISRNEAFSAPGVEVVTTIERAFELARGRARRADQSEIMVIGGASIYSQAIPLAGRLYLTQVHGEYEGDTYLPAIDWSQWEEVSRDSHLGRGDSPAYSFVVYNRRNKSPQNV